jgi:ribosomal protein S18 acetylase RimI-like enzyme
VTACPSALDITGQPVRRLDETDLPAIVELTAERGWPPEKSKWRLMFAVSEPFGVADPAGGLAGIVVLTRYRPSLAAVGMMVVASRHGRRGLGGRLMRHVLDLAADAVVYLTATPHGQPLYERLGFRVIDTSVTYRGVLSSDPAGPAAGGLARPVSAPDLAAIAAADQAVFGAERNRVLAELVTFADRFAVLGDPATGFGAAWTKDGTRMIGPLVADGSAAAARLTRSLAGGWAGPVRMDVLGRHRELAAWAAAAGLHAVSESALMVYGGELPGDRARLYCPVSVAIG